MLLDDLVGVIETLKARIQGHSPDLQANETRTRMALIDPLLQALGWDTTNPALVLPEYDVSGKRADYALLKADGNPAAVVEAKKLGESLVPHRSQMVGYSVEFGVPYAGLTDGDHWELYDVFQKTPLDKKKVLDVSLAGMPSHRCALQLLLLWRPNLASGDLTPAREPIIETTQESLAPTIPTEIPDYPETISNPRPLMPPSRPSIETPSRESTPSTIPSGIPDHPENIRNPRLTPSNGDGWISVANFRPELKTRHPSIVRFPNGEERPIRSWKQVLIEVAEWLVRKGALTDQECPVQGPRGGYIVHYDERNLRGSHPLSNDIFIEVRSDARKLLSDSRFLLQHFEEDGSQVLLRLG